MRVRGVPRQYTHAEDERGCFDRNAVAKSLKMQNSLRTGSASQQDKVELSQFAAENVFGTSVLVVKEKVVMPNTEIPRLNDLELKTNLDL